MRRVVVTGLHVACAAGEGSGALRDALRRGAALGTEEEIRLPRGGCRRVRVARIAGFDPDRSLKPGAARRMSLESRLLTASFHLAANDAGCASRPVAPERTGTFLGSGFGALGTTVEYLRGMFQDGLAGASPSLFSESLASAPLGHAAIDLDARGPSFAFTGGDLSTIVALDEATRAIRAGRIDRAICGAFELMPPILVRLLARLGARADRAAHVGEGVSAFVLEAEETALASGAKVLVEIAGAGLAGDPKAPSTDWSRDPEGWAGAHRRALACAGIDLPPLAALFRHAPPSPAAARAEGRALEGIFAAAGRAEIVDVHRVTGCFAAAGGLSVAAAVLAAGERGGPVLVSGGSWGGATGALLIAPGGA